MKKLLIFALLIVPVASFGASSVRVLGAGTTPVAGTKTTTTSSAARVTPSKVTVAKPAAAATASNAATSRIGTIRVKPKTTTGTLTGSSTGTTTAGSRFPVITPAHSYDSVKTPQVAGGTTVVNAEEDTRVDMIHMGGDRENYWRNLWVSHFPNLKISGIFAPSICVKKVFV